MINNGGSVNISRYLLIYVNISWTPSKIIVNLRG